MLDTLFLSGYLMNLTKIFKIVRQFFNLSKIEGGDTFFSSLYGRSIVPIGRFFFCSGHYYFVCM